MAIGSAGDRWVPIPVHARAGSRSESIEWDPWRKCWTIRCRAPARAGEANAELLRLLAAWLGIPSSQIRWRKAGRSASKTVEVHGLLEGEVEARLDRAQRAATPV
jgi:uncharacterized protein YggU (UPF0235/DUF167 family)